MSQVAEGHPVAISTDDKMFFRSDSSREHLMCAEYCALSKQQIFGIAQRAVDFIFAGDEVKAGLRDVFAQFAADEKL